MTFFNVIMNILWLFLGGWTVALSWFIASCHLLAEPNRQAIKSHCLFCTV